MPFYDYYNKLAATRIGRAWSSQQARNVLRRLRAIRPSANSVLEIGPGHGAFAAACRAQEVSYVALDINKHLLQATAAHGHAVVQTFVPPLPVLGGSFDVVFASHVIEHCAQYREAFTLVEEMRRVVAPGGLVALVAPDYLALGDDFWNCDYSHSFVTTRRRLRQIMVDGGVTVIDIDYLWGPLEGVAGRLCGPALGGRMVTTLAGVLPEPLAERVYKMRLTFARSIFIVGQSTP